VDYSNCSEVRIVGTTTGIEPAAPRRATQSQVCHAARIRGGAGSNTGNPEYPKEKQNDEDARQIQDDNINTIGFYIAHVILDHRCGNGNSYVAT